MHGAKAQLARAIGVTPVSITQWTNGTRPIPINRCIAIEEATNGIVTRRDLRPDDWQLIWPEMHCNSEP